MTDGAANSPYRLGQATLDGATEPDRPVAKPPEAALP